MAVFLPKLLSIVGRKYKHPVVKQPLLHGGWHAGSAHFHFYQPTFTHETGNLDEGSDWLGRIQIHAEELLIPAVETGEVQHTIRTRHCKYPHLHDVGHRPAHRFQLRLETVEDIYCLRLHVAPGAIR